MTKPNDNERPWHKVAGEILRVCGYAAKRLPSSQWVPFVRDAVVVRRSGYFDSRFYLRHNGEVGPTRVPPLAHFLHVGGYEGRAPSEKFDCQHYLRSYPDVAESGEHPLLHYLRTGRQQDRVPVPVGQKRKAREKHAPKRLWDVADVASVTWPTSQPIDIEKLYLVSTGSAEPSWSRHRIAHLGDLADGLCAVESIDLHEPPPDFWVDLERGACVVVAQRVPLSDEETRAFFQRVKASPCTLVYHADSYVFGASDGEGRGAGELEHPPAAYHAAMELADQFFVPTTALRNTVAARYNRPVHVVHHSLPRHVLDRSTDAPSRSEAKRPFVVGLADARRILEEDLAVALPGLLAFMRQHPEVELRCLGDVRLPDAVIEELGGRLRAKANVPEAEWQREIAAFDVQLLPLADRPLNRFESHLRFLESAAAGVPVVASSVGEQGATIIDGHTGFLVGEGAGAWSEALGRLHEDGALRATISRKAREHVEQYWHTESRFQTQRLRYILEDASLGLQRDKISVNVVAYNPVGDVRATVDSVLEHTAIPFELLIWNNSTDPDTVAYLRSLDDPRVMVTGVGENVGKAVGANHLFRLASERFLCGLDDDYEVGPHWDIRMISAAKAVPNLGWLSSNLTPDSSGIRDRGVVHDFGGAASILRPSGVGGWMVFTTATAHERVGSYTEHGLYGGVDGEYNRRARRKGLYTGYVRHVLGKHKTRRSTNPAWELHKQRIQDQMRLHGKQSDEVTDKFVDFFGSRDSRLSVEIMMCTSVKHDENVWGDTHFARGLQAALERLDYRVRLVKHEEWYEERAEAPDIVIHLFGLHKYQPDTSRINILWIISHTDLIDRDFVASYDAVFCASDDVAEQVRSWAPDIRVETLTQCTDSTVFCPDPNVEKDLDVVFVGNSRRVFRPAVKFAVESGAKLSVWGTKWEQYIDRKYIVGQSISSHETAEVYRRAKVVLNDHWQDQRDTGLINNRIFDVLACQTAVLSDYNPGIEAVFGPEFPVFDDQSSFQRELERLLSDPEYREGVVNRYSELALTKHTFVQRAARIHDAIMYVIDNYVEYKSERQWQLEQAKGNDADANRGRSAS